MLPSVGETAKLQDEKQADVIGLLFEPCPVLVELVRPLIGQSNEHTSWPSAIKQIRSLLHSLDVQDPRVPQIIAAHPQLGAKKVDSQQSRDEQRSLEGEASALGELNQRYEQTFPGLRYVVFVAGRSRPEIFADIELRIAENDYSKEVSRAFDAMCDIALDRHRKLNAPSNM